MDWNAIGSGAIDTGLTVGLNAITSGIGARRQYKYNKRLMQEQYRLNELAAKSSFDRSIQAWNMENEYNLPSNQMLRFKAAGLNPNLIYGHSNTGASLSSPEQKGVSGSSISSHDIDTGQSLLQRVSDFLQLRNIRKQGDLIDSEIATKKAGISESQSRTFLNFLRFASNSFDLSTRKQMLQDTLDNLKKRNLLLDTQIGLTGFNKQIRGREYLDYSQLGIRPQDPYWIRAFIGGLRGLVKNSANRSSFDNTNTKTGNFLTDLLISIFGN